MRNRALHDALRDFALEAAALLSEDAKAGAEVEFEVLEEPARGGRSGGSVLYRYRPLTREFLAERWPRLRALPSRPDASRALGSGAAAYLRVNGLPPRETEPALLAMLERLYEDATSFGFPEERFERVYEEVERTLYGGMLQATVLAPLAGVTLLPGEMGLGDGLALASADAVEHPPEAAFEPAEPAAGEPAGEPPGPANALLVLRRDIEADAPLPVEEAGHRFTEALTGLRLFKPGRLALGPLAFARVNEGTWQPVALAPAGPGRGDPWTLEPGESSELPEFMEVIRAARPAGPIAWALSRFEMGCERSRDAEALSDYLLALRALLEGPEEVGRTSVALRLAALGAEEPDRRAVQRRVELAFSLERFVIGGGGDAYADAIGFESPRALVEEIEEHLRALLRDVLCGYLDRDLKGTADDILMGSSEPLEIEARDLRGERERRERPAPEPATEELWLEADEDAGEPAATSARLDVGAPPPEAAVTPSADWDLDEDAESYSAPV